MKAKRLHKTVLCALAAVLMFGVSCESDSGDSTTYYTVSFDTNGSHSYIPSQTVESGKTATKPEDPTRTGYTFDTWYNGETEFDFSTPITADLRLTAHWNQNVYTVYASELSTKDLAGTSWGIIRLLGEWTSDELATFGSKLKDASRLQHITFDLTQITGTTRIGDSAFSECSSLESVMIGGSITTIGDQAFSECTSLVSITIDDGVTSIGNSAFSECSSLKNVTIGNGVETIGDSAFKRSSLESITIPGNVTSIGDSAFSECSSLKNVTIDNGVKNIGSEAFNKCSSLASITIPSSVTSIGRGAFFYCTQLASIVIPSSVTSIGINTFSNCTSLATVTIGNGVAIIGEGAFFSCTSLASITIPASVMSLKNGAFSDCTSLTSITFAGTTTQWNSITKSTSSVEAWNHNVPATKVTCNDGEVSL